MIRLDELARELLLSVRAETDGSERADPIISDVTHDSRLVTAGSLFCCLRGATDDGHDHAEAAVRAGAVALVCEHPLPAKVPQLITDDPRRVMSAAANLVWGRPSERMTVIGVTGTNGKTTVVSMLSSILRTAGLHTGTIGTLTGERTTPESTDLHRRLASFVADGVEAVAMEVSSHALVQRRVADVDFDLTLFTNLGRDHLDFHRTQEAYFAAKAMLFEPQLTRKGVVNVDDVHGRLLFDAATVPMVAVSLADVSDQRTSEAGSTFSWRGHEIRLPMVGHHNVSNAILAATAAVELGLGEDSVVAGLESLEQVPGRFEVVNPDGGRDPAFEGVRAVVDYAHTPDAMETTLRAARELAGPDHRVIVVFGCGGERDSDKRPQMGAVAATVADLAVVTSDNPRGEDPGSIIDQILGGFGGSDEHRNTAELRVEPDRRAAINLALDSAASGDVVVVAGKGHETGQTIGGRIEPFDDRVVVAQRLGSGRSGAGSPT